MTKEEVLKGLEEAYDSLEKLHDSNLDRMTNLHEQLRAIDENNTSLRLKMKELANKIHEVKNRGL